MSSIDVVFEVLPEEKPGERSAPEVWEELRQQLDNPHSVLRSGEFGRYASQAYLSGGGFSSDNAEARPVSAAGSVAFPPADLGEVTFPTNDGFGPPAVGGPYAPAPQAGVWAPQGPYDTTAADTPSRQQHGADWQASAPAGLSNTELVAKISSLEKQLSQSNVPGIDPRGVVRQEPPASVNRLQGAAAIGPMEAHALQDKCTHYERRLETVERELREAQEASRLYRTKAEQLEVKLKDREQLLVHAKEMWMKENVRASKLADSLTVAEDKLADQEKRLTEVSERYNEAQQEMRQFQHLLGKTGDYGAGGYADHPNIASPKGMRSSASISAPLSSSAMRLPSTVDTAFGAELLPGEDGRSMPSSSRLGGRLDSADLAGGDVLPFPPLEAETNADRFLRLCILNDAVLYEDELLQIGVKMEFVGREGQIGVYFGNKGNSALQAFTVQYFVREENALRVTASPLSQQLDADKQVVQRVTAQLLEPFVDPVWLRVQFLLPDTSPRRVQVKFPLIITKFMIGRELSSQEFFQQWRQQHLVLNEVTNIVHLASRLKGQLVNVARSIVFGGALRLHHGVDTNPDNFVLVSQLAPAAPGQMPSSRPSNDRSTRGLDVLNMGGDRESGLSLIRVEVGSGRFTGKARVVVRSSDHLVARALCDIIVAQLSETSMPHSSEPVGR